MGIWLQGGTLVINAAGSPFDCDDCPCIEYEDCNPCLDESTPRTISITFGYDGSATGGFGVTDNEVCLENCTNPNDCDPDVPVWEPGSCPDPNYSYGFIPQYPCCEDGCSDMAGPFDLRRSEVSVDPDCYGVGNCLWQGDIKVCCNTHDYGTAGTYTACPFDYVRVYFKPPDNINCGGVNVPESQNNTYWNIIVHMYGWGGMGSDNYWWGNITDIEYDSYSDPSQWPLNCSQLSNKPWLTFGPDSDFEMFLVTSAWTSNQRNNVFPYDCPCDIGSDGGLPTIKAQVSFS